MFSLTFKIIEASPGYCMQRGVPVPKVMQKLQGMIDKACWLRSNSCQNKTNAPQQLGKALPSGLGFLGIPACASVCHNASERLLLWHISYGKYIPLVLKLEPRGCKPSVHCRVSLPELCRLRLSPRCPTKQRSTRCAAQSR